MIDGRVADLNWSAIEEDLDNFGLARAGNLLGAEECRTIAQLYDLETAFRSRVIMARHGFGRGEYRYFSYPLPAVVEGLRTVLYAAGQIQPTPLLLQYVAGDFNCLHQDIYGEHVFPLQAAILLSEPGSSGEGCSRYLSGQASTRRKPCPLGPGAHARNRLSRCRLNGMLHHRPLARKATLCRRHIDAGTVSRPILLV